MFFPPEMRWVGSFVTIFFIPLLPAFFDGRGKAAWLAANQELKQDPAYGKKWILDPVFVFRHPTISQFLALFARNFWGVLSNL